MAQPPVVENKSNPYSQSTTGLPDADKNVKSLQGGSIQDSPIVRASEDTDSNDRERDLEKSEEGVQSAAGPAACMVAAQDWAGPDDPENPHNWSMSKRAYHTLTPALFGFAVTFASSVYTPAYPEVMQRFGVSSTAALLGLSLYVVGLAFGPMLAAPISETYGRLVVYRLSLPVFMLFTLGAGFSQNFASLLVCRFFAGFTGSPVLAVGAGTNVDMFPAHLRAIATSTFLMAPFLGPALGPFIGGFAAQHKSWQWTQWCTLFIAVAVYLVSLGSSETYKKAILEHRAKRLGIPTPPKTGPSGAAAVKFLITVTLFRPVHMLFVEPIVGFFSLYTAFTFAVLFAFFAAFPIVFHGVYGFTTSQVGLTFLAVGLGVVLAVFTAIACDRILYQKHYRRALSEGRTAAAPEHRLYSAMLGSMGIPIGLFWFGWTARADVHWASPVIAAIPFAWGNLSIFTSAALYTVDVYGPLYGASAVAANGLARYFLGAAFPLFTVQMYHRLGIAWATSILGFISLAMLPIPWVLFKWGPKIRAKSHYDTLKA